eukprot:570161-Rhodomonas_salina.1
MIARAHSLSYPAHSERDTLALAFPVVMRFLAEQEERAKGGRERTEGKRGSGWGVQRVRGKEMLECREWGVRGEGDYLNGGRRRGSLSTVSYTHLRAHETEADL